MDWQNLYYQVTDQHDKLSAQYETLEHKLEKEKELRVDRELQMVDLMKNRSVLLFTRDSVDPRDLSPTPPPLFKGKSAYYHMHAW